MPSSTALGFRVPDDSDPFADGATATRNLGEDVNDKVGLLASGSVVVSLVAAATGTAAVVFPVGRFAAAPRVVATPQASTLYAASVSAVTAAGCNITLRHLDSTVGTVDVTVSWIAHRS